ncbi:hypothetical protein PanWU01x14_098680 [Parasponia andersonii]|uniref:Uncharacterized protein n=1 Tax=Parasponia andersonii TaxID=3476 RepID=A0A2P5D434_PARAD|nr:hypothetical protein PanWU01x14_098680 [Parasponia andersonii]
MLFSVRVLDYGRKSSTPIEMCVVVSLNCCFFRWRSMRSPSSENMVIAFVKEYGDTTFVAPPFV